MTSETSRLRTCPGTLCWSCLLPRAQVSPAVSVTVGCMRSRPYLPAHPARAWQRPCGHSWLRVGHGVMRRQPACRPHLLCLAAGRGKHDGAIAAPSPRHRAVSVLLLDTGCLDVNLPPQSAVSVLLLRIGCLDVNLPPQSAVSVLLLRTGCLDVNLPPQSAVSVLLLRTGCLDANLPPQSAVSVLLLRTGRLDVNLCLSGSREADEIRLRTERRQPMRAEPAQCVGPAILVPDDWRVPTRIRVRAGRPHEGHEWGVGRERSRGESVWRRWACRLCTLNQRGGLGGRGADSHASRGCVQR